MSATAYLRRLVLVKEGEVAALLWSAAYFFCLLSSYYILRPVREMSGIERGADKLPWLMTGTMAAMFVANPLFSWLVSRTPRRRFIPITYHFFAFNMLLFWGLMKWLGKDYQVEVGYAFYIWLSVFNLFVVSVFWSFLADMFTTEQSKRLFGAVGIGGTIGSMCGAGLTAFFVKWVGNPFNMLIVSLVLLELAVVCVVVLNRLFGLTGARAAVESGLSTSRASRSREPGPGILVGVGLVLRSPYLLLICVYLFLYAVLNTFLYLQQGQIVDAAITDRAARTAFFAKLDLWTNLLTLATQLFLAGRLIRWLGVGITLALLPLISVVGFAVLWLVMRHNEGVSETAAKAAALNVSLVTVAIFVVVRRGIHYAISQPSRQILFTHLGPDEIYKSKPFIDTFVYRGGDLVGAWAPNAIVRVAAAAGLGAASAVAGAGIPIAIVSLGVGLALGRMQTSARRTKDEQPGSDATALAATQ